jgi:copper transport protein
VSRRRVAAAFALAVSFVVVWASPASAHATLLATDPVPGAVLQQAPRVVTLNFDSPVSAALGAVRVYDRNGTRVDSGGLKVSGATVRLPLPRLGDGAYVVTWRVTSSDTHPVGGAFTFQVGNASNATSPAVTGLAQRLLGKQGGDRVVGAVYGVTRGFLFAGLALFIGAAAFAVLVWPGASRSRRARRLVWAGWTAALVGTVAGFVVYGPYAAGLGFGNATRSSLLAETLHSRLGELTAARLLLLLLAVPVVQSLLVEPEASTRASARWRTVLAAALAVLLAATPGLAGHAVTGRWVSAAVVADTFHVLAMAVWLGGLAVLVSVLLPTRHVAELRAALPRWSRVAAACVAVIVGTGVFQAYRQVGGLAELRSTDYGRLLVVKLVVFAFMLTLASFGREIVLRFVPRAGSDRSWRVAVVAGGSDDGPPDGDGDPGGSLGLDDASAVRSLRRSVWVEVGAGAAVLAVTALLVNAAPARSATAVAAGANGGEIGVTMKSPKVWVDVILTPGRPGSNDVHVSTLRPNGAPQALQALRLSLDLPNKRIAPIAVPLSQLSTGHYLASSFAVPLAGTWRVTAYPLFSKFDEGTVTGTLKLGAS